MASKERTIVGKMSPTTGKCLRYLTTTTQLPVAPDRLVVGAAWSDLPHNFMEAKKALQELLELGLADKKDKQYTPTKLGEKVNTYATKIGLWQKPPARSKTNRKRAQQ